ncbi:dUTP diphosphatase [Patescibacteria group bacterium]
MKLKIKKLNSEAKVPQCAIGGDAAMDLYSIDDIVLKPGDLLPCKTGIAVAIPEGYAGLIWDKSGIALNGGIKTMGGVIDSNYRGEIAVIMVNLSKKDYTINKGDKVAQILIQKVECPMIEEVEELDDTERGEGGFGSTGLR